MRAAGASLVERSVPAPAESAALWVAYPRESSKRYQSDFSRDGSWETLGRQGLEPVRQAAIDDDWSALRFRRMTNIKTIGRDASMP
ncbi:MAG: hypothetical protein AB7T37_09075 [Dehalococcoidia bacterium]